MIMTIDEMISRIDLIADTQRALIVGDPVRAFEYQIAEKDARAYAALNYTGDVPGSVGSWAMAKEWSPRQAADDIIGQADLFMYVLNMIRAIRLNAKCSIIAAGTPEEAQAIFDAAIGNLKQISA